MPKDSQPDNKRARMEKCNYQTPITRENQNKNRNAKHQSIGTSNSINYDYDWNTEYGDGDIPDIDK